MKFLFLVGSALKHFQEDKFSAYDEEQRFEQTLETIECIRKKVPNSYVVLLSVHLNQLMKNKKIFSKKKQIYFWSFMKNQVSKQSMKILRQDQN